IAIDVRYQPPLALLADAQCDLVIRVPVGPIRFPIGPEDVYEISPATTVRGPVRQAQLAADALQGMGESARADRFPRILRTRKVPRSLSSPARIPPRVPGAMGFEALLERRN